MRQFERSVSLFILIAVIAACAIIVHKSSRFITVMPRLSVDDSIPNVAVALAEHGRYGFLASPTQGPHEVDRTHAFYNYGPAYFWVASALTWLMGPSLTLYRMLHPLGLIFIVLLNVWAFRRVSMVGPALFTLGIFERYLIAQSPIARPDIMVSISAVLMLIGAAHAIERGSLVGWFAAGFFASTAVTSHQIAVAMVPAAGVIWLWSVLGERREWRSEFRRRAWGSFAAIVAGGAVGALVYLAAIDFRWKDLWELGSVGVQSRAQPFFPTVRIYFNVAWGWFQGASMALLVAGFCSAALVAVAGSWLSSQKRRQVLALLMPPVVAAALYQISVGFWGSPSNGYVILSQVTTLWAMAALAALLVAWARESFGPAGRAVELTALCLAALLMARTDAMWLSTPGTMERQVQGNVDINDYVRELMSPLPERAAVWGSLHFGTDAGDRTDLVQFQQVFNPALDTRPESRGRIVPDFLVLGGYEFADTFAFTLANLDNAFSNFFAIFPDARYRQVKLVGAPPYGTSVAYQRITSGIAVAPVIPEVAINDGTGRQWHSRLSGPMPVGFRPVSDVTAEIRHYSLHAEQPALAALSAALPAGFYLIDVEVEREAEAQNGFILASAKRHFVWNQGDTDLPVTPYFFGDRHVQLLVDHWGGPLYISRYETREGTGARSSGTGIEVRAVRSVIPLMSQDVGTVDTRIPSVDGWSRGAHIALAATPDGEFRATASDGGWVRLTSPPIPATARYQMMLTVPVSGDQTVTVGILKMDGMWLVEPVVQPRRVVFDTGDIDRFQIALDSSGPLTVRDIPQVTILRRSDFYADTLVSCRSQYIQQDTGCDQKPLR